jgi:hypothetical protein
MKFASSSTDIYAISSNVSSSSMMDVAVDPNLSAKSLFFPLSLANSLNLRNKFD